MNARILVVGGAGYIGSHVSHDLVAAGHQVVVFDDLSSGDRANVPDGARLVVGDMRRAADLDAVLEHPFDVVYHFAALKAAAESMADPHRYAAHNVAGSLVLLDAVHRAGVRHLVFSSSAAVYGAPEYLPMDEQHPCRPENYYGYSKLVVEQHLAWYARLCGLRYAALRYFNATGYDLAGRVTVREKDTTNLCPILMEVASGLRRELNVYGGDYDTRDGTCVRDYVHVNDLADAHVAAMDALLDGTPSLVLNLGTETGASVLQMVAAAERVLGRKIPYRVVERRPGDPAEVVAAGGLARQRLGFVPRRGDPDTIFSSMRAVYGL